VLPNVDIRETGVLELDAGAAGHWKDLVLAVIVEMLPPRCESGRAAPIIADRTYAHPYVHPHTHTRTHRAHNLADNYSLHYLPPSLARCTLGHRFPMCSMSIVGL